jgi:hypothetical protein
VPQQSGTLALAQRSSLSNHYPQREAALRGTYA